MGKVAGDFVMCKCWCATRIHRSQCINQSRQWNAPAASWLWQPCLYLYFFTLCVFSSQKLWLKKTHLLAYTLCWLVYYADPSLITTSTPIKLKWHLQSLSSETECLIFAGWWLFNSTAKHLFAVVVQGIEMYKVILTKPTWEKLTLIHS